jgi:hypothetical protein
MGRVRKIVKELNRLEDLTKRRLEYLSEIKDTEEGRAVMTLVHDDEDTVKNINGMLKGKKGKELETEVIELISYYENVNEVVTMMNTFITKTA